MTNRLCILSRKNASGHDRHGNYQLEKPRPHELDALLESNLTLAGLANCNATLIRANPERTSWLQLSRLRRKQSRAAVGAVQLNPISSFENYASKLTTFSLWRNSGLQTPDYMALPLWASFKSYAANLKALAENGCYLRTSNEDSGKGLYHLAHYSEGAAKRLLRRLRFRTLVNKVGMESLLAVKPVENRIGDLGYIYRVHLVGNTIVGGYAICADTPVIHVRDLRPENMNPFLQANQSLLHKLQQPGFSEQLVRALSSLNIHIAAIEFFLVDNQPVFLEVNPVWGGLHRFGDAGFQALLEQRELPKNIQLWLNPAEFYRGYWLAVNELISARGEYSGAAQLVSSLQTTEK
ncbi:hypothetical protein SAMN02745866_00465 [Alteromonadaceae bacterium Bs31]|nr:hypothetical protein SAMN02745866_00465 [Alteromonadaceae bacterium Bs31]